MAKSIKRDDELKSRVQRLAGLHDRSAHRIMRGAITQYVDREEKREAFKQDEKLARGAYRSTGLHVTHDEADAWLAKLDSGEDAEPPKCHE
ncbi:hypothetical protein AWB75_06961 [Caballeronia catudaia]|uniref:Trifunctional transcriptional regulator/proline dehydrogenase/pyrroline-5-carboxylate dehydrogenase n=1 Tax=Caballeronia catudaia TaxID=1777136 RepID=A0A158DMQ5_9BURK|nr:hypothetical protein [Caballeronia catudaia]SAK95874.1 hypothetical protein AWB75_06961 [Caballeronia catudaia]